MTFTRTAIAAGRPCARCQATQASGIGSMRVYVVRHEKRNRADATFLSPLLPEGVRDARGPLVNRIEEIRPTHIYASPFLRVLQTVQPYVSKTHEARDAEPVLVNVDYGLYESPNPDQDGFIGEPPAGWEVKYHLNPSYCSSLSPDELRKGWGFGDTLQDRTRRFLCHIRGLHHGTEDCVLLASHQYTIHSLISLTTGQDPSTMNFPQGEIAELEWWEADLPEIQMASAMPTRSF